MTSLVPAVLPGKHHAVRSSRPARLSERPPGGLMPPHADDPEPPQDRQVDLEELRANLLRDARSLCPSWLADEAEDLAQVALMRALRVLKTPEGQAKLKDWRYRRQIARSVVTDAMRQYQRQPIGTPVDPSDPIPSPTPGPDSQLRLRELRNAIASCLKEMNRRYRRAAWLSFQGHSAREIRRLLGCDRVQVYNLIFRGRRQLLAKLVARGFKRD